MEPLSSSVPSVALVVGAGGPTGGPFIWSALAAIEERTGWKPQMASMVVGTSAGAFVAARLDAQVLADADAVARLAAFANGEMFRPAWQTRIAARIRVLGGRVIAAVAPMNRPFAEYGVPAGPFHGGASAITVRRRSGRRVQHVLGSAKDAAAVVRASAAIPGVNKPVEVDGTLHVDGAVHSANNADVVDDQAHHVLVVISPMIPQTGGSLISRFHRAQLRCEIEPWMGEGRSAVVVMPSAEAHAGRRDREFYEPEGARAVQRLVSY